MKRGYLAVYRKIQDHPFYKEKRVFSKYEAWLDILIEARHSTEIEKVLIGMKTVDCGYGQSVKSLRTWGGRWGWTAKKVSRFFNLLEEMNQIRHESVTVTTRITVLNYSKYNLERHADVTQGKHKGNAKETQGKHAWDTDKHYNHVNNENNDNPILSNPKGQDDPSPKKAIKFQPESDEYRLALFLFNHIKKRSPNHKEPNLQKWASVIDLMIRKDKRDVEELKNVISWCQDDDFWQNNILSTDKLRKQYDQLVIKMQSKPKQQGVKRSGFDKEYYGESSAGRPNDLY